MIKVLGVLTKVISTDNVSDDSENPTPNDIEVLDGWHVNSTSPISEVSEFQVTPNSPYNVFAGVDTYFYVFPDSATAQTFGIGIDDPESEINDI